MCWATSRQKSEWWNATASLDIGLTFIQSKIKSQRRAGDKCNKLCSLIDYVSTDVLHLWPHILPPETAVILNHVYPPTVIFKQKGVAASGTLLMQVLIRFVAQAYLERHVVSAAVRIFCRMSEIELMTSGSIGPCCCPSTPRYDTQVSYLCQWCQCTWKCRRLYGGLYPDVTYLPDLSNCG